MELGVRGGLTTVGCGGTLGVNDSPMMRSADGHMDMRVCQQSKNCIQKGSIFY